MKAYIDQIYNEGLGSIIYVPTKKFFDRRIKNKNSNYALTLAFKIIYGIISLSIGVLLLYVTYPL